MKKIDIHCHTTKRELAHTLPKKADIETIISKMKEHEIEKTVLLASYFPHTSAGISNFRLSNWIGNRDDLLMFGSLDFEHYFYQGINELNELVDEKKMKGIKIYTCYQNIDLKGDKLNEVINLAKRNSLVLNFHCGYSHAARRTYDRDSVTDMVTAEDIEFIAREHPNLKILVAHLSKPSADKLAVVLNRNPNMYTDMSGLVSSLHDRNDFPWCIEEIKKVLYESGPQKLLFGTDFPVQTHEDSIYFVEEAMKGFSDKDKSLVYYDNAKRLLNI